MKLCWNTINDIHLTENGNLRHKTRGMVYIKDACSVCGEPFIGKKHEKCCSRECSISYVAEKNTGQKRSKEVRAKFSEIAKAREPHRKHSIESVKNELLKEDYVLLSTTYTNNKTKLDILCPKGHLWKASFFQFQQGNRCFECSGKMKHTIEYIKERIESIEGYKLLSKVYEGALRKLKVMCPEGHIYDVKFNNFQQGQRCLECYKNSKPYKYEYVKECVESTGYKLLSNDYKNCKTKLLLQCDKGHKYKATYNSFNSGERCPVCYANCQSSRMEKELYGIVKSFVTENVISNDRTQIVNPVTGRYFELDIWIPTLRKAIEFNGTYWHSIENAIERDEIKRMQCKEKHIDLLTITEKEWIRDKENCCNGIKEWLNESKEN